MEKKRNVFTNITSSIETDGNQTAQTHVSLEKGLSLYLSYLSFEQIYYGTINKEKADLPNSSDF
jgi:hypothetical protein